MRPSLDEVIDSIRWTFQTHVVPALPDGLLQSYSRTIGVLLEAAALRAQFEPMALQEEMAELETLLEGRGVVLPDASPQARSMQDMAGRVSKLRGMLANLIIKDAAANDPDVATYVRNQVARENRFLPDMALKRAL